MTKDISVLRTDPEGLGPAKHLISIFDPSDVGKALYDNGWNNSEAVQILTEIARDTMNNSARERMAAVKMLEDKSEKSLTLAGIIRRVSMEALQEGDGTKKKLTAEGLQIIKDGSARTLSTLELLEAAGQTQNIIDVDAEESSTNERRTNGDVLSSGGIQCSSEHLGTSSPNHTGGSGSSGSGRGRTGSGPEPGLHELERPQPTNPQSSPSDNQTTIGGTEDERSTRPTVEPGRGIPSSGTGNHRIQPEREYGEDNRAPLPIGAGPGPSRNSTPRRTTPYTPGEARRRATAASKSIPGSDDTSPTPDISTPRASDGSADARSSTPHISARFLSPTDAAAGFPGDESPG